MVQEAIQAKAGLDRLQYMTGIDSNDRNLLMEDEAIRRDVEMDQREQASWNDTQVNFDGNGDGNGDEMGDNTRILAARDVHFHHPRRPEDTKPSPTPNPLPTVANAATLAQKAAPWIAAAGLGLGGLGLGYGLAKPTQAVSPSTDINQTYEDKTIRYYQIDENGKRVPIAIPHISKAPQGEPE